MWNLPKTGTTIFGEHITWHKCIVCGRDVFTTSSAKNTYCGGHSCLQDLQQIQVAKRIKKLDIPNTIRWAVWERDNFTCQECGTRKNLTIDHIYPESKGGDLSLDNLQTLCHKCNSSKGNRL